MFGTISCITIYKEIKYYILRHEHFIITCRFGCSCWCLRCWHGRFKNLLMKCSSIWFEGDFQLNSSDSYTWRYTTLLNFSNIITNFSIDYIFGPILKIYNVFNKACARLFLCPCYVHTRLIWFTSLEVVRAIYIDWKTKLIADQQYKFATCFATLSTKMRIWK